MSPCIVILLLYLSFKISLNYLPAMDSVIASIRMVAIIGQPLILLSPSTHLNSYVDVVALFTVNSNILTTTHSAQLHTCKSLVRYFFKPNASSTELLGASEQ